MILLKPALCIAPSTLFRSQTGEMPIHYIRKHINLMTSSDFPNPAFPTFTVLQDRDAQGLSPSFLLSSLLSVIQGSVKIGAASSNVLLHSIELRKTKQQMHRLEIESRSGQKFQGSLSLS